MRHVYRPLAITLLAALPATVGAGECAGTVYLTFDTGNMVQAENIAKILRDQQVKATFFVANEPTFRGDHALDASWRDYWRARVAEGHVVGNHTYHHNYLRRDLPDGKVLVAQSNGPELHLDERGFCAELKQTDDAFHQLTGTHLAGMWRAPGGRTTQSTIRWAADCGYPLYVQWDTAGWLGDELDSDKYPNDLLLKRALDRIRPGTIVIMHLGIRSRKDPLAPILAPLIRDLKARGYCFAPLAAAQR